MTKSITQKAVDRATSILHAAGVRYYVEAEDGTVYASKEPITALAPSASPKAPRVSGYERNAELRDHIYPIIGAMAVGDVASVPCNKTNREAVRGVAMGRMSKLYGAGSFVTSITKDVVEILRVK